MHDILMTLGVVFLLFLIICVTLLIWLLWSTILPKPIKESEFDATWEEWKRVERQTYEQLDQMTRSYADREFERERQMGLNQENHIPVHDYSWADFQRDDAKQRNELMNERKKR